VNIVYLLVLPAMLAGGFLLLARLLGWKAVDGWRQRIWGEWSSRFQMGGLLTLLAGLPIDPVTGLSLWNMMPREVREIVPAPVLSMLSVTVFVLAWLSRYQAQPRLREKIEENKS
jgi:hypothetical protein